MTSNEITDYEDLTRMKLTDDEPRGLRRPRRRVHLHLDEQDGYPVGVVVAYVWRDGKFWTTCAERRTRVPALTPPATVRHRHQPRPQDRVVQGRLDRPHPRRRRLERGEDLVLRRAVGHRKATRHNNSRNFEKFLDSPHRVIIETEASLVVSFDAAKFDEMTAEAITSASASSRPQPPHRRSEPTGTPASTGTSLSEIPMRAWRRRSGAGAHQFQRPASRMKAGTSVAPDQEGVHEHGQGEADAEELDEGDVARGERR